jgi:hypothetical protein
MELLGLFVAKVSVTVTGFELVVLLLLLLLLYVRRGSFGSEQGCAIIIVSNGILKVLRLFDKSDDIAKS